ncbi:MAG TPA: hypothetical protein VI757_07115, partial [Bacteroidia bacterium]|nr:hypothetical protein [Bacteroidia bacterium]
MLIRFFRSSQPGLIFLIPGFALLWFVPIALSPAESFIEMPQHAMPVYEWLATAIGKLPFIVQLIISWVLISAQAIYLNQLIIKYELFPRLNFLPALFFVTLSVLFPEIMKIQPALFVNFILIFVLDKIFRMYKNPEPLREVFDCSFLLAVAMLLQSSSIAFYFFLLLSLVILLPFYWRTWVISLIGFALPFYFISIYFFWIDRLGIFWNLKLPAAFTFIPVVLLKFNTGQLAVSLLVFLIMVFSLRSVAKHFYKNIIRTRRFFQINLALLITGFASILFTAAVTLQSLV